MSDDREWMRLHVETLFTMDDAGRLLKVNEAGGGAAPRFFLGRTAAGDLCWARHDVPGGTVEALRVLCDSQPVGEEIDARPFLACLARDQPVQRTWSGPAYRFPEVDPAQAGSLRELSDHAVVRVNRDNAAVLSRYLADWRPDAERGAVMAAALEGGHAVAVCCSVRTTELAHEAGVETHVGFRRRGYGEQAVRAWAAVVRDLGRFPLYSTSWENAASLGLARRLGLIPFGTDLHIT